ncbi:hypothetical protein BDZ89DRAFT_1050806 [Hymenopellis radicata]|nr:hypothetical protein BDZ89DRAFT_1050806 [Hymenopellis radicata]
MLKTVSKYPQGVGSLDKLLEFDRRGYAWTNSIKTNIGWLELVNTADASGVETERSWRLKGNKGLLKKQICGPRQNDALKTSALPSNDWEGGDLSCGSTGRRCRHSRRLLAVTEFNRGGDGKLEAARMSRRNIEGRRISLGAIVRRACPIEGLPWLKLQDAIELAFVAIMEGKEAGRHLPFITCLCFIQHTSILAPENPVTFSDDSTLNFINVRRSPFTEIDVNDSLNSRNDSVNATGHPQISAYETIIRSFHTWRERPRSAANTLSYVGLYRSREGLAVQASTEEPRAYTILVYVECSSLPPPSQR